MLVTREDGQVQIKKRKRGGLTRIVLVTILLLGGIGASLAVMGIEGESSYHQSVALAQTGIVHLRRAETLLTSWSKHPFNEVEVEQANQEFSAAQTAFMQLDSSLKALPAGVTLLPLVGARLSAASHLVPSGVSVARAGIAGCRLLSLLSLKMRSFSNPRGSGITIADLTLIEQAFQQSKQAFMVMVQQVRQVQPADLQFDPRLSKMSGLFQQEIPTIQRGLDIGERFFAVAPVLPGLTMPGSYLVEVLDSTELRPGGGFIGSYGIATIEGGRLISAPITDSILLDKPFNVITQKIPYPAAYNWFSLAQDSWSFRDSNLDADFPTTARNGEQTYMQERGKLAVAGVIAITPMFIQHVLTLTGPINVPEYHETVTAQNLIELIHYHQLDPKAYEGSSFVPAPDGHSSLRKHFTALLADQLFARLRTVLPVRLPQFAQLLLNALHTKDLQLYFNSSSAEQLLQSYQIDGSIQAARGDDLEIVDANIGASKANSFITSTANDQITLDADGNVLHHLVLNYAWVLPGHVYGSAVYRDYLRIYVPPGSTLRMQSGWQPRGTGKAFGHAVWAGFFTLTYGQVRTITLDWTVPHLAGKIGQSRHYAYLFQKQAGVQWKFSMRVALPGCAVVSGRWGGLNVSKGHAASLALALDQDLNVGIDYRC